MDTTRLTLDISAVAADGWASTVPSPEKSSHRGPTQPPVEPRLRVGTKDAMDHSDGESPLAPWKPLPRWTFSRTLYRVTWKAVLSKTLLRCVGLGAAVGVVCASCGGTGGGTSTPTDGPATTVTGTIASASGADALTGYLQLFETPGRAVESAGRSVAAVVATLPDAPGVRWSEASNRLGGIANSVERASQEISVLPVPSALKVANQHYAVAAEAIPRALRAFAASLRRQQAAGLSARKLALRAVIGHASDVQRQWHRAVARYAAKLHIKV